MSSFNKDCDAQHDELTRLNISANRIDLCVRLTHLPRLNSSANKTSHISANDMNLLTRLHYDSKHHKHQNFKNIKTRGQTIHHTVCLHRHLTLHAADLSRPITLGR